MSQHDFTIDNQGFPAFRSDLNNALQALVSVSAGASAPSTTFAYQLWYDSTNNILKMRNADDDAWISLFEFDQTADTASALSVDVNASELILDADADTSITSDTDDQIDIRIGGTDEYVLTGSSIDIKGNELILDADGDTSITADTDDQIDFKTGGSDRVAIDASGNVGIGTTSPAVKLHVDGGDIRTSNRYLAGSTGVSSPDYSFAADGSMGMYRVPGSLCFSTGGTERMRIDASGNFMAVKTAVSATTGNGIYVQQSSGQFGVVATSDAVIECNRNGTDGILIHFRHAGTSEGYISVSGTTVSYNGGHLARWSRLADNTKDTSIVKGTVMTNLDQMVVWSHDEVLWTEDDELPDGVSVGDVKTAAYTEENEQLNCMAVSSTEGDANVAGVFVNWDDSDDYNDMNIAMTGDMVIRIASGTTVARGDLLMSAGDGTAKPQGDDIVRSKTIAKVTSTNVSHTYNDGSYLVPCVLMAC